MGRSPQTLWDMASAAYVWALIPMAVVALATALVALRTQVLPAWVAYTGFALALGLAIPFVSWVVVFFLFVIWTAALGIVLYRRQPAAEAAAEEAMPATPTPA